LLIPILYLSGEKDELVPARMMKELFDNSTASRKRHILYFKEGTHMDTFMQPKYYKKLKVWIKSLSSGQTKDEDEVEEVSNRDHALLTGEHEELEELVEGSL